MENTEKHITFSGAIKATYSAAIFEDLPKETTLWELNQMNLFSNIGWETVSIELIEKKTFLGLIKKYNKIFILRKSINSDENTGIECIDLNSEELKSPFMELNKLSIQRRASKEFLLTIGSIFLGIMVVFFTIMYLVKIYV